MKIRYVGGPLDGKQIEITGAKPASYRTDDGAVMPPRRGDRVFVRREGRRDGYALIEVSGAPAYLHASVA